MHECKPLPCGARFAACNEMPNLVTRLCELGRGSHPSTFWLNVSAFCEIGCTFRDWLGSV